MAVNHGVGTLCCDLAKNFSAYVDKSIAPDKYICGQSYGQHVHSAPDLSVPTTWCQQHCPGYALSQPSDTAAWATPLVQYILPAALFSMTIPRRLVLEPPKWFFDFNPHHLKGLLKAICSLSIAGLIVTLDTAVWTFLIMIAPGPFIFSGLVEAGLDYSVIRNLQSSFTPSGEKQPQGLNKKERVQLLIAVLAGNLEVEGVPADPQQEMEYVLDIERSPEEVEVRLRAMLACQYPFGAAVGGPILFYIGSFIYTLASLHNAEGDRDTARALAFGIWWMNIVHVAAISGCLLASNNPSTAAAIVRLPRIEVDFRGRLESADKRAELEDKTQARLEAWSRLSLTYRARYEPVWMWTRGKCKARWLRRTAAWRKPWFRDRIEMTMQGWMFVTLVAYLLVLFPCALAFWIEYNTPAPGPGCRSMTILVYACAQFTFVILSAWSHFKASYGSDCDSDDESDYWDRHKWLDRFRRPWLGIIVASIFLVPAWITAVFTTFAGTLMQITGIYNNCICSSTGYWSFPPGSTVTLSTDTEYDRRSSWYWTRAGYTALIFLACVTYLGWWCQRYLREKFIDRVKHLVDIKPTAYQHHQEFILQVCSPSNHPETSESPTLQKSDLSIAKNDVWSGTKRSLIYEHLIQY